MTIKFGVFVPQGWKMDLAELQDPIAKYEAMTKVAREADNDEAWDSIWLYDHFHTVPAPVLEAVFECWTASAALARDTKRVRIGQMVSCAGYRSPALYAKIASTVDVASHGRLNAGLGAGWYEHEWRAYGYGFPDVKTRMGMFREACEIIYLMWTENYPVFHGKYYSIDRPINEPNGVQQPHIPLWIGGSGERVTLRLVARFGDACNINADPPTVKHKLDVLRQHCADVGRNYAEIIKSSELAIHLIEPGEDPVKATERARRGLPYEEYTKGKIVGPPDVVVERLNALVDVGIEYFIIYMPGIAYDQQPMRDFAQQVMPRVRERSAAQTAAD